MKRFQAAAVAACVATTALAAPAGAASLEVEGSVCALYLETPEERSVGYYYTSVYPKPLTQGGEVAGIYLSVVEAKDYYQFMETLTDTDPDIPELRRFSTPEEIAAIHEVSTLLKQCGDSTQRQAQAPQNGSSSTAAIAISVLALVASLAGLALPFVKDLLPA